jgi:hypothetical protein
MVSQGLVYSKSNPGCEVSIEAGSADPAVVLVDAVVAQPQFVVPRRRRE